MQETTVSEGAAAPAEAVDWIAVGRICLLSRALDDLEEQELVPERLVAYQFSSRGHELAQALLGMALGHPRDAATVYYRSRPFLLTCGLTATEALAGSMGRVGGPSGARDIGVVHSLVPRGRATVLPMSGAVGSQYTPATGWASAIRYRVEVMGHSDWDGAIAVAMGGEGSTSTPGFWAALNIAATGILPMVFMIEDNGYAISVPATVQTPGGNIARNLGAFDGLLVLDGDGTNPAEAAELLATAVARARSGEGPAVVRLVVPRLSGHSFADTQAYKPSAVVSAEEEADPLPRLRDHVVPRLMTPSQWDDLAAECQAEARRAAEGARDQSPGDPATATRFLFHTPDAPALVGGARPEGASLPQEPPGITAAEPVRINMVEAIRRTLAHELGASKGVVVFGEDVGVKGGVHGATRDLALEFGAKRVFDTSLTEEGIIGRAIGMAVAGLVPVPEIQFRKYADAAMEQLNDLGTIRWRTAGRFAAPVVVRIPVGTGRATGDPWHSVSGEAVFAHQPGWRVALPSNAADAVGLLRTALRGDDPTLFLEHRSLYDAAVARRPYPGDRFMLPFGEAATVRPGTDVTLVTWGALVHTALEVAADFPGAVEVLDLRTIVPWDREAVLASVRRTGRCLVCHEDNRTAGFGAEIAATVTAEAFQSLDAPVRRLAAADCPVPYSPAMAAGVLPSAASLSSAIQDILAY